MALKLPERKKPEGIIEPKRLLVFSQPKVGKTSLAATLPNSLILDLEDGSENYECASFNIRKIARDQTGNDILAALSMAKEAIVVGNTEAKKAVYDFIIIDTTSALEKMANDLANITYRNSNAGKKWEGVDVVTELEYGAGYQILRNSFIKLYNSFQSLAGKGLIFLGHVKNASINKNGASLTAKDIDLIGKDKQIICSDCDAIGFLYREKETYKNILSFKTNELDLATGARPEHLTGKEFIISQKFEVDGITPFIYEQSNPTKHGVIKTYWENVYPSLKK